jgi:hypothetical protein
MQCDAEELFDVAATYLPSLGFALVTVDRPRLIVGKRGKMLGSCRSFKVTEWATRLSVHFTPEEDGVMITCDYEVYLPISGIMTARDASILDDEIEAFQRVLERGRVPAVSALLMGSSPAATASPDAEPPPYLAELENLARLRDRQVITEDEFNRKKLQILAIR